MKVTHYEANMLQGKPSKRQVERGDIFVVQMRSGRLIAGRVISVNAKWYPEEKKGASILVYLYKKTVDTIDGITVPLEPVLIIPPTITNNLGWRRGYFQTVRNIALQPQEILPVHCFKSLSRGCYFNEYGEELEARHDPCGTYGLDSYANIGDEISKAIRISSQGDSE